MTDLYKSIFIDTGAVRTFNGKMTNLAEQLFHYHMFRIPSKTKIFILKTKYKIIIFLLSIIFLFSIIFLLKCLHFALLSLFANTSSSAMNRHQSTVHYCLSYSNNPLLSVYELLLILRIMKQLLCS